MEFTSPTTPPTRSLELVYSLLRSEMVVFPDSPTQSSRMLSHCLFFVLFNCCCI